MADYYLQLKNASGQIINTLDIIDGMGEEEIGNWALKHIRRSKLAEPESQYVVRLYDGFDNEWMDVHGPCSREEADQVCGDRNEARIGSAHGKRTGNYDDIDYYGVFQANTRMRFS
jgi:hypothetical protein